ncbi:MAG: hypothetical protein GX603_06845 [Chloroflexi bacterium]|nr:hypothetical protein [Chloroflexota bacterium]
MAENGGTTILAAVEARLVQQFAVAHTDVGYSDYSDYSDEHHDDDEEATFPEDYGS